VGGGGGCGGVELRRWRIRATPATTKAERMCASVSSTRRVQYRLRECGRAKRGRGERVKGEKGIVGGGCCETVRVLSYPSRCNDERGRRESESAGG
jgi:hypothetical protein